MAAIYSSSTKEGVDINAVFALDTGTPEYPRPPFNPGELAWGTDGSEWVYATASTTLAAGSAVIFSGTAGSWSVALLQNSSATAHFGALVGVVGGSTGTMVVPAPSGTQTGMFFWVQRAGNVPKILTAASVTAYIQTYTSAVGGLLGPDVSAVSYAVNGIVFSTNATTSATAYAAIANYPTVGLVAAT